MPNSTDKPTRPDHNLVKIIRSVRNRWRLKVALGGLAMVLGVGFGVFFVATLAIDYFRFEPTAVMVLRVVAYLALVLLILRFMVMPLARRVADERVALYLEEHEPSLQAALISAVEADRAEGVGSSILTRGLVEQAVAACRRIDGGSRVERRNLRRASGTLASVLAAGALVLLWNPGFLRHGLPFLLFPWGSEAAISPYSITVSPGDTLIGRGADQLIDAQLLGFTAEPVELVVKRGENAAWERLPMTPGAEAGTYETFLFDLAEAVDYYAEADGVKSPVHRIDVVDIPSVRQLTLRYHYPAYTGLESRTVEDGGDISALRGTRVELQVQPSVAVPGGDIVVNGRDRIPLMPSENGTWTAELEVADDGYYRVDLEREGGQPVTASPDYTIAALEDQPPTVALAKPGRDSKATRVEEPYFEVKAEDDLGIERLELMLSVNGGPDEAVVLHPDDGQAKDLRGGHTLYLEELDLQPGDLIAFHARVSDSAAGGREATTDIYFLEVRSFRRDYRSADQQGGGMAGSQEGSLSAQQRELVVATFKMIRDRDTYLEAAYHENLLTLARAEARIRDRVEAIIRRLGTRDILQLEGGYRKMAEELPQAVEAMHEAEASLNAREPQQALSPAQKALQHLQRAEAAFREAQVTRGNQGGGGGTADAEDLANLFKLELDKLRNQYETVQRGRQETAEQEIDEVLQKLRELARRQQQENERLRRRTAQQQGGASQQGAGQQGGSTGQQGGTGQQQAGASAGGRQQALAEEVEQLARKLERLTRKQEAPELQAMQRRLEEAAEAMRRAAEDGSSEGLDEGRAALDQLREARRLLDKSRSARLGREVDDALKRAERLAAEQENVAKDVRNLAPEGERRERQLEPLLERKERMAKEVEALQNELEQTASASKKQQPEAARKLRAAADSIRENQLAEKISQSGRVIQSRRPEFAETFENQIGANIDELRKRIEEAAGAIGESREQRLARSLEQMQELLQGLESLQARVEERAEQSGQQAGQAQDAQQAGEAGQEQSSKGAQPGEDGQPGEGSQPGEVAQSGQDGQSGQGNQPGQGGQPGEGSQPGEVAQSGQDGQSGQGNQPGQGGQPGEGSQPGEVAQSGQDGQSGQGSQPGQGGQPGQNGQPGEVAQSGQGGQPGARSAVQWGGGGGYGWLDADGRVNRLNPEDVRRFSREFSERRGDVERLGQVLHGQGFDAADIDAVLQRLQALERRPAYDNPEALARLQAEAIETLKELEYALRRELQSDDENRLRLAGNDDVPAGFRELVEEYYRELSRQTRK